MANSFVLSVRLNDREAEYLEDLSSVFGLSKADTIRHCLQASWMEYNKQSPETKDALSKISALSAFLKELQKQ